jgi:hypothetical protein
VIEKILAFSPSTQSLLSMGYSAGACEAVLSEFCKDILFPVPRTWKAEFGLVKPRGEKMTGAEFKRLSVDAAQRRYPGAGRISHDTAEAILLALFGLGGMNGIVNPSIALVEAGDADDPWARA